MTARRVPTKEELEAKVRALEAEKKAREERQRLFVMGFGVYIVLVLGAIGSQVVMLHDNLMAVFNPVELGQVGGAMIVGVFLFSKLEEKEDLKKAKDVGRVLRNAFTHGFFWMSILGAWW